MRCRISISRRVRTPLLPSGDAGEGGAGVDQALADEGQDLAGRGHVADQVHGAVAALVARNPERADVDPDGRPALRAGPHIEAVDRGTGPRDLLDVTAPTAEPVAVLVVSHEQVAAPPPDHLALGVAEHALRRPVPQDDPALRVDGKPAVRGPGEQLSQGRSARRASCGSVSASSFSSRSLRPGCPASGAIKVPSEDPLQLAVSTHVATAACPRKRRRACCGGAPDGEAAPQGGRNRMGRAHQRIGAAASLPAEARWSQLASTDTVGAWSTDRARRAARQYQGPGCCRDASGPSGPAAHRPGGRPSRWSTGPSLVPPYREAGRARSRSCPHCARRMP